MCACIPTHNIHTYIVTNRNILANFMMNTKPSCLSRIYIEDGGGGSRGDDGRGLYSSEMTF